jgi:hypothetical protein
MRLLVAATVAVCLSYAAWNQKMESLIPKAESQAVEFSLQNIDGEASLTARLDGAGSTAGYMQDVVAHLPERVRNTIVFDGDSVEQTIGSTCRRLDPHGVDVFAEFVPCR